MWRDTSRGAALLIPSPALICERVCPSSLIRLLHESSRTPFAIMDHAYLSERVKALQRELTEIAQHNRQYFAKKSHSPNGLHLLIIPVWIVHPFGLDSSQRAHGITNGLQFYVFVRVVEQVLPAEEYSCFRGLYALVQLPRVAFNERRFKLILPIWKFRFEGMLSGPYFRLAFLPDCRERATERG